MKKSLILGFLVLYLVSCEKNTYTPDLFYKARIVGYDKNCSTCILEFPYDSSKVRETVGKSEGNYYEALNMNRSDFLIGQVLDVRIRKAVDSDLGACLTLYPSINYKNVVITAFRDINAITLNDTIQLALHNCLIGSGDISFLCFDSVLNDSRCPTGAECFWAGNAAVRFRIIKQGCNPLFFTLNTILTPSDTSIYGYNFSLAGLNPYPAIDNEIKQEDYIASIIIKK